MKFIAVIILIFTGFPALSQTYSVTGNIVNEKNNPIHLAEITITNKDATKYHSTTDKEGAYTISGIVPGFYYRTISAPGYDPLVDSFDISKAPSGVGVLHPAIHMLDEVKVVEKILAMVQKDDTLEFNSGAFKVNPDADAADLVRKMPSIEINGKSITAQGESVIKILVDGKPFFGNDPYASLKNLPADIIDKVQVYNEKSDQEQFTGFSEGNTSKTINIITKPDKRNGIFGKVFAGGGGDPNSVDAGNANDDRYGTGATLNEFAGDRRITVTGQSNNVNVQNFSDNNSPADGGAGITTTNAGGVNYTDKWGKKADVSGSYFFNESNSTVTRQLQKTYVIPADSGQVYNETSPSANQNYSHRFNMRLSYTIDTMNSIIIVPALSFNKNDGSSTRTGSTEQGSLPVNYTNNYSVNNASTYALTGNILYRHKFHKKGRTFSVNLNTNDNNNNGNNIHIDTNIYYASPALSDTLNQRAIQQQNNLGLNGNATYTEPSGKNGMLKLEYNYAYQPSVSDKNTYDYSIATNTYSLPDTQYSNSFTSRNTTQKGGVSYLYHLKNADFSVGLNYQLTEINNNQTQPIKYSLGQSYQNLLPVVTFHYKITKSKNLQCTYNTSTQAPSVSQLQNVINNSDPLHLYTGNPALKQTYRHNLTLRYNSVNKEAKNNFSASVSGTYSLHNIASNSIIAQNDSIIGQGIILPKGSQLTIPVNVDGNSSLTSNMSYGMPLGFMKCRLNFNVNAGLSHIPAIINNAVNYQDNKTGGIGISMSSNISENVDFIISSNTNIISNANSINQQLNTAYINESSKASLNLISPQGFVFNTSLSYQTNSGLPAGYDQNYLLCNMSIGKKVFRKRQGDIRLSVFDLLNENNNIQHTVTDIYIQDTRSNILQRYVLLVFTYKISEFKSVANAAE